MPYIGQIVFILTLQWEIHVDSILFEFIPVNYGNMTGEVAGDDSQMAATGCNFVL